MAQVRPIPNGLMAAQLLSASQVTDVIAALLLEKPVSCAHTPTHTHTVSGDFLVHVNSCELSVCARQRITAAPTHLVLPRTSSESTYEACVECISQVIPASLHELLESPVPYVAGIDGLPAQMQIEPEMVLVKLSPDCVSVPRKVWIITNDSGR